MSEQKKVEETRGLSDYEKLGKKIGEIVTKKQESYGNAFEKSSEVVKVLYPNGINTNQYVEMLTVLRIIDKLFRVATDKDNHNEDPFLDIAGYGLLMTKYKLDKKRQEKK